MVVDGVLNNVPATRNLFHILPDQLVSKMTLFLPLQYPGPQLSDEDVMELDLFCLYVTDKVLEHFVEATNDYAEAQKASKPAMYLRFKKSPFTKL